MQLEFREINENDGKYIERVFDSSPCMFGWEYDFVTIWSWNTVSKSKTYICVTEDSAIIKKHFDNKVIFFPPYSMTDKAFDESMQAIKEYCKEHDLPIIIRGLSVCDVKFFSDEKYKINSSLDSADYIYSVEELISLSGKKFHAKRNFVNRFEQSYSYEFNEFVESDIPAISALFDKWEKTTTHEKFHSEKIAIMSTIEKRAALKVKIGVLRIGGNVVGFSLVSVPNELVSHYVFEKADTEYVGVYQMLCKLTVEKFLSLTKYVNRQEDMGIEGLRRAKQSYNPVMMIKKYDIEEKYPHKSNC